MNTQVRNEEEWEQVTEVPEPLSKWVNSKGDIYTVVDTRNTEAMKQGYPITVCYDGDCEDFEKDIMRTWHGG